MRRQRNLLVDSLFLSLLKWRREDGNATEKGTGPTAFLRDGYADGFHVLLAPITVDGGRQRLD